MQYLICDIGGSSIKYAIINDETRFLEKGNIPAPENNIGSMIEALGSLYERYRGTISAIGVSACMVIDYEKNLILEGGRYTNIRNVDLARLISARCGGLQVAMINDSEAALQAEMRSGVLTGCKNGVVIVIGTGIGCAFCTEGKIYRGYSYSAGEVSFLHTTPRYEEMFENMWCEQNSAKALVKRAKEVLENSRAELTGIDVFRYINEGNAKVLRVFDKYCMEVATQVFNIQMILDPEITAIGGAISIQPVLIETINQKLDCIYQASDSIRELRRNYVVSCKYHNDANLYGAFYELKKALKSKNRKGAVDGYPKRA